MVFSRNEEDRSLEGSVSCRFARTGKAPSVDVCMPEVVEVVKRRREENICSWQAGS